MAADWHRRVVRAGALTIAAGVVVDLPPHLVPKAHLDLLALVGHLIVLAGMVIVLGGLVLAAISATRTQKRRIS